MTKHLMTAREVAETTGLKLSRIYSLSREGKIPLLVIGDRQYRYPEARIEQWLGIVPDDKNEDREVQNDD